MPPGGENELGEEDSHWLQALIVLLAPLAPRSAALLEYAGADEFVAVDSVLEDAGWLGVAGEGAPQRGWLLRLPSAAARSVLLDADPDLDPAGPAMALARQVCRAAWRLREPMPVGIRDELPQAIHDLRNGLNSVTMTGAVIASAPLSDALQPFVADLQAASRRSLRALAELSEWLPRG